MEIDRSYQNIGFTVTKTVSQNREIYNIRNKKGEIFGRDFDSLEDALQILKNVERLMGDMKKDNSVNH